jgi:hypothetical protein
VSSEFTVFADENPKEFMGFRFYEPRIDLAFARCESQNGPIASQQEDMWFGDGIAKEEEGAKLFCFLDRTFGAIQDGCPVVSG